MIDFQNVSKSFGGKDILKNVSFRINSGEKVGIVGPNGSGKTTIFNIITGVTTQDSGTIAIPKDSRIGIMRQKIDPRDLERELLEFTADAIPELHGMVAELHDIETHLGSDDGLSDEKKESLLRRHGALQSTIEHIGAYHLEQEAEEVLTNLGFPVSEHHRRLKEFSGGWQMRAALAKVLISHPDIFMLDEPSNYLDVPAVEWLCRFLNGFGGTLVLISHDRFLLRKLTNVIMEVNSGVVTRYPGSFDHYVAERENRLKSLESAKRNSDRKREQMERVIDRFRAKSTKAAQAKSWMKKLEKIEEVQLPDKLNYQGIIRFPAPPPSGVEAVRLENLSFGYTPDKLLFSGLDLDIHSGEKIAFIGYNGLGKTTLLKLICGKLKPLSGKVVPGHHAVIGYQAQDFSELLNDELTVFDAVKGALPPAGSTAELMNVLGSFGFSGSDTEKRCGVLSGGERIRVQFARIFVNPPNFLILDEPTTHLDLAARELLQKALVDFPGTVCLVSHDIEFVRGVATAILAITPGRVKRYFGNYDYYLEKSAEESGVNASTLNANAPNRMAGGEVTAKERRQQRANARKLLSADLRKAKDDVAALEKQLDELSTKRQVVIAKLSSGMKLDFGALKKELAALEKAMADTEAAWETRALELEALRQENNRINSQ